MIYLPVMYARQVRFQLLGPTVTPYIHYQDCRKMTLICSKGRVKIILRLRGKQYRGNLGKISGESQAYPTCDVLEIFPRSELRVISGLLPGYFQDYFRTILGVAVELRITPCPLEDHLRSRGRAPDDLSTLQDYFKSRGRAQGHFRAIPG